MLSFDPVAMGSQRVYAPALGEPVAAKADHLASTSADNADWEDVGDEAVLKTARMSSGGYASSQQEWQTGIRTEL